jgi:hypothetical protein
MACPTQVTVPRNPRSSPEMYKLQVRACSTASAIHGYGKKQKEREGEALSLEAYFVTD